MKTINLIAGYGLILCGFTLSALSLVAINYAYDIAIVGLIALVAGGACASSQMEGKYEKR